MASPLKSMALQTRMGGNTTPMTKNTAVQTRAPKSMGTFNVPSKTLGSNAQSEQMARTINKTNKVQQTYGMLGRN